jgi:hypothetical protein
MHVLGDVHMVPRSPNLFPTKTILFAPTIFNLAMQFLLTSTSLLYVDDFHRLEGENTSVVGIVGVRSFSIMLQARFSIVTKCPSVDQTLWQPNVPLNVRRLSVA